MGGGVRSPLFLQQGWPWLEGSRHVLTRVHTHFPKSNWVCCWSSEVTVMYVHTEEEILHMKILIYSSSPAQPESWFSFWAVTLASGSKTFHLLLLRV